MNIKQIEQQIRIKDLEIDRVHSRISYLAKRSLELRMEIDTYCEEKNHSPHSLMEAYYEVASEFGSRRREKDELVIARARYQHRLDQKMNKKSFFRKK